MMILQLTSMCVFLLVAGTDQGEYISRMIGGIRKICVRIYDCKEDHEILPCHAEYTHDTCQPCPEGLVRPHYVSSTEDLESTKCFKNRNKDKCRGVDIIPSRTKISEDCPYCKCNTEHCSYGDDPCICSHKPEKCPVGETLNNKGDCIACPEGTWKNATGCGPCLRWSKSTTPSPITTTTEIFTMGLKYNETGNNGGPINSQSKYEKGGKSDVSDETNQTAMYISLSVAFVLLIAFIVILSLWCHGRKQRMMFTSVNMHDKGNLNNAHIINIKTEANIITENNQTAQTDIPRNHDDRNTMSNQTLQDVDDCHRLPEDSMDHIGPGDARDHRVPGSSDERMGEQNSLPHLIKEIISDDNRHVKNMQSLPLPQKSESNWNNEFFVTDDKPTSMPLLNNSFFGKSDHKGDAGQTSVSKITKISDEDSMTLSKGDCSDCNIARCNNTNPYAGNGINIHSEFEQVSEHLSLPVRQVSGHDDPNDRPQLSLKPDMVNSLGPPSSGYMSGEFQDVSPLSAIFDSNVPQSYNHLVSVSDRTERTDSLSSGLEYYNVNLVGVDNYQQVTGNNHLKLEEKCSDTSVVSVKRII